MCAVTLSPPRRDYNIPVLYPVFLKIDSAVVDIFLHRLYNLTSQFIFYATDAVVCDGAPCGGKSAVELLTGEYEAPQTYRAEAIFNRKKVVVELEPLCVGSWCYRRQAVYRAWLNFYLASALYRQGQLSLMEVVKAWNNFATLVYLRVYAHYEKREIGVAGIRRRRERMSTRKLIDYLTYLTQYEKRPYRFF